MSFLVIGEAEQREIIRLKTEARKNPVPFTTIKHGLTDKVDVLSLVAREKMPADMVRPPSMHMKFPGGYRAALSAEEQPVGLCWHLSISVEGRPKKGMMPSEEATKIIAEEFGIDWPGLLVWIEEFEPGEYAVNIVGLITDHKPGNA